MRNSFHHTLMKTYFAMHRRVMDEAKKLGLTSGQPKVLEYLSECEGVEQKTIAENCEIESATVGSVLLRMEQAGLCERRREGGNRRSLFVYLTPAGKEAAASIRQIFAEAEKAAFCGMEPRQKEALFSALGQVYANLTDRRLTDEH